MNVTVAVEEVHIGDEISMGGPRKTVKWKSERDGEVKFGFGAYLVGDSMTYERGTLVDIKVGEDANKAYMTYDGTSMKMMSVLLKDDAWV